MLRRTNISAAIIVVVCFFLPWEQVSCGGARDTVSGLDLARNGDSLLFLIPLLMLAVVIAGAWLQRSETRLPEAIISLVAAGLSGYLMNKQRVHVQDQAALISAQLTGWFWAGLLATMAVGITAIGLLLNRRRET